MLIPVIYRLYTDNSATADENCLGSFTHESENSLPPWERTVEPECTPTFKE